MLPLSISVEIEFFLQTEEKYFRIVHSLIATDVYLL